MNSKDLIFKNKLADLYFASNSVQFGAFKISAHEANPDLPLTPLYLHYPKQGQKGYDLLPEMFDLIGELFHQLCVAGRLQFDKITGIPAGADPFAKTTAQHFRHNENLLLRFEKSHSENDGRIFSGPLEGTISKGQSVLVLDDHTSGGYNKSLFVKMLQGKGLRVSDVLTVVDREQGASEFLQSIGITLHSIFTITELLDYYQHQNLITISQATSVKQYINENKIIVS